MAMNYAGLKGILDRLMYLDTVTVRRQERGTDAEGAAVYALANVYEDIPCKLSQYGKALESHQEDRAFKLTDDLRLCCDPAYDIRPADVLLFKHQGQEWQLVAGQAFKYPTHQEIQARKAGEG